MTKGTAYFAFTRYLWVWLAGAAIGAGAGAGCFAYALYQAPRYTALISFEVWPPTTPLFGEAGTHSPSSDDTEQVLKRQRVIFEQDAFLKRVLASDEFHPGGAGGGATSWLAAHRSDPVAALKRDLRMVLHENTASLDITFTSPDASEAQRLVQAAGKEYRGYLMDRSKSAASIYVAAMAEAVRKLEDEFKIRRDQLTAFGMQQKMDVLKTGYQIEVEALKELNTEYIKANAAAASAEAQWAAFNSRQDSLRFSGNAVRTAILDGMANPPVDANDVKIAEVLLSLEMKQFLAKDATLQSLTLSRLQGEQELAVEKDKPGSSRVSELTKRIEVIDKQVEETRGKLQVDALQLMEKTLKDEAISKRAVAAYIGDIRKQKEAAVSILGQRYLQWDQMVAEVTNLQDMVNKIRTQFRLAQANLSIDDTRMRPTIDIAAIPVPTEPSWPEWQEFVWDGAAAGLVLGALAALGLGRARARRLDLILQSALPATHAFPTA